MRHALPLVTLVALAAAAALSAAACGGSASETPWPVEPDAPTLGPAGEAAPPPGGADAGAADERRAPNDRREK